MAAVSESAVRELKKRIDVTPAELRNALAKAKGNMDAALLAVIDSGEHYWMALNPLLVNDGLFVRSKKAFYRRIIATRNQWLKKDAADSMLRPLLKNEISDAKKVLANKGEFVGLREEELKNRRLRDNVKAEQTKRTRFGKFRIQPFPPLALDVDEWTGRDKLPAFAGYRVTGDRPSSGAVELTIPRLDGDNDNPTPPAAEQVAAYQHLKTHQKQVMRDVSSAVMKAFRKLERSGYFTGMNENEVPAIASATALKRNMSVFRVMVLDHARAGHAYVGLSCHCSWDEEHGLGVLLHKSRIVAVGQMDTASDHFAARDDGGKKLKPRR